MYKSYKNLTHSDSLLSKLSYEDIGFGLVALADGFAVANAIDHPTLNLMGEILCKVFVVGKKSTTDEE